MFNAGSSIKSRSRCSPLSSIKSKETEPPQSYFTRGLMRLCRRREVQ